MIKVVAAFIEKEGKILIAKRLTGDESVFAKWEFPGGKVEKNETEEKAIEREIKEELEIKIKAEYFITNSIPQNQAIDLRLYKCSYLKGKIKKEVHSDIKWITIGEIDNYNFAPADQKLVNYLKKVYANPPLTTKEYLVSALVQLQRMQRKDFFSLAEIDQVMNQLRKPKNTSQINSLRKCLEKHTKDDDSSDDLFFKQKEKSNMWSLKYRENIKQIYSLQKGEKLTGQELHTLFKSSIQGGIRRSYRTHSLLLISDDKNGVYEDEMSTTQNMIYTGAGQEKDQKLENGNQLLARQRDTQIPTFLFKKLKSEEYEFIGQVVLKDTPYQTLEKDKKNKMRVVWKFPLQLFSEIEEDDRLEYDFTYQKVLSTLSEIEPSKPISPEDELIFKEGPLHVRKRKEEKAKGKTRNREKQDYLAKQIVKKQNGEFCELLVLNQERKKVAKFHEKELLEQMEEFFENRTDSEGYDILSFEMNSKKEIVPKYIEVKSTISGEETPIDITRNELEFARENKDSYYLYRIVYSNNPKKRYVKVMKGDPRDYLEEEPFTFKLYGKNK